MYLSFVWYIWFLPICMAKRALDTTDLWKGCSLPPPSTTTTLVEIISIELCGNFCEIEIHGKRQRPLHLLRTLTIAGCWCPPLVAYLQILCDHYAHYFDYLILSTNIIWLLCSVSELYYLFCKYYLNIILCFNHLILSANII